MRNSEDGYVVTVTDELVRVEYDRKKEQIKWTDIDTIKIITTDQGPFHSDVWMVLSGDEGSCSIPQGTQGYDDVYNIVSKYARFDFENVINAMSSVDNEEFLVWTRE